MPGVLKQAWLQPGKSKTLRVGVDGQHKSFDILTAVSAAVWMEQSEFLAQKIASIKAQNIVPVISRFYDCTPMRLGFGRLQPQLHPHALYPVKVSDNRWASLPLDEFLKVRPDRTKSALGYGMLELLAQGAICHYSTSQSIFEGFRFLLQASYFAGRRGQLYFYWDRD